MDRMMEISFERTQQEANRTRRILAVWRVTPDKHDAKRMTYCMAREGDRPHVGASGSRTLVDYVYPTKEEQ